MGRRGRISVAGEAGGPAIAGTVTFCRHDAWNAASQKAALCGGHLRAPMSWEHRGEVARLGVPWVMVAAIVFNLVVSFNDGGNLVASFVAARAFSLIGAALVLLVGAAVGPWLLGTAVAHTIVFGIVALPRLGPGVFLAAVGGAILTLVLCWSRSLPTSTSLALVGGLAGAGFARAGPGAVHWGGLFVVLAGMVGSLVAGGLLGWATRVLVRRALRHTGERAGGTLRALQLGTGLLQGVAYGGNGLGKAIGLFALAGVWAGGAMTGGGRMRAAVVGAGAADPSLLTAAHLPVPAWAVWAAVLTFGAGMALGGARIARRVGYGLFPVRAADALAAQLAAGLTVMAAAALGEPVSTTQTVTSALVAVGAARRLSLPRWPLVAQMGRAWAITLPLSLGLGAGLGLLLRR